MAIHGTQEQFFNRGFYILECPDDRELIPCPEINCLRHGPEDRMYNTAKGRNKGQLISGLDIRRFYIGAIHPREGKPAGVLSSFDLKTKFPLGSPYEKESEPIMKILLGAVPKKPKIKLSPLDKEPYQKAFQELTKDFKQSKDLRKNILFSEAYGLEVDFPILEEFVDYCEYGMRQKNCGYFYAFYSPQDKLALLGLTPEYIFKKHQEKFITTAVAGTKSAKENWSTKLKAEHTLVKESIEGSLDQKIKWTNTKTYKYGQLEHLKSEGEFCCSEQLTSEISLKLHPTAAIGSLPKEYALKNSKKRGFFGGYAELTRIKNPFSLVLIRGFEWKKNECVVRIGGGVLPESEFEKEWQELENKFKVFKKIWNIDD